jgi:hypothetical protein
MEAAARGSVLATAPKEPQRLAGLALAACLAGCGHPTMDNLCPDGGAAECASDGKSVVRCQDGLEVTVLVCGDTQVCDRAMCREVVCPPSTGFCDGRVADSCNALGTVETRTDCEQAGQACVTDLQGAHCVAQSCTPNQLSCSSDGTQVLKCDSTGQSLALYQTCSDPQLRGNTCMNGVCVDRCALAEAGPRTTLGCRFVAAAIPMGGLLVQNPQTDLPATVSLSSPGGGTHSGTVMPSSTGEVLWVGNGPPAGSSSTHDGVIVISNVPIYAWQIAQLGSGDGSTLLPEPNLGKVHYVPLDESVGAGTIKVVATAANSHVTVTPNAPVAAGSGVGALTAGQPATFALDRGDLLVLDGAQAGLSGTRVEADQPIAVFAAQSHAASYAEAPVLPWAALGRVYLPVGEPLVVVAREDGTTVNGKALAAGQSVTLSDPSVQSDRPVAVLAGGPAWLAPAPVEQWLASSTVASDRAGSLWADFDDPAATLDGQLLMGGAAATYWAISGAPGASGPHLLATMQHGVLYAVDGSLTPYGLTGSFGLDPINP